MRCHLLILLTATFSLVWLSTADAQQPSTGGNNSLGGYPIAATRRAAIDARPFHRPLDKDRIRKWMEIASQCTMAEFELFLSPLSPQESKLLERIEKMPAPIVNRLHFEDLRSVLKNRGLLSLLREEALKGAKLVHTTPAVENKLYGAFDCVFASVGPPSGSPRYGDVVIRLKNSVREHGWATPFSGMHFVYAIRHKDARKMQSLLAAGRSLPKPPSPMSLSFDDRLHFSHYVVTEKHWEKALAYQAMLVLRNLDDSEPSNQVRRRFERMLIETDPDKFWALFIPAREPNLSPAAAAARTPLGYLEGKFTDQLSIDDFTAIEVPPARLNEVRAWPEAKPYLDLIKAKPKGVH